VCVHTPACSRFIITIMLSAFLKLVFSSPCIIRISHTIPNSCQPSFQWLQSICHLFIPSPVVEQICFPLPLLGFSAGRQRISLSISLCLHCSEFAQDQFLKQKRCVDWAGSRRIRPIHLQERGAKPPHRLEGTAWIFHINGVIHISFLISANLVDGIYL
jgi:hypothetical protein